MTKLKLVEAVYQRHGGISRRESAQIVDVLLGRIKRELGRAGTVRIAGFGSFRVVQRRSRKGSDPRTGAEIDIAAVRAVVFKPSKTLVRRLD